MSLEAFKHAASDLYQGEITGEVSVNLLLKRFTTPRQQYVLGTTLQLETETKARLRPAAFELGVSLEELGESRQAGTAMDSIVDGLGWCEANTKLAEALTPIVERYRAIAEAAPAKYKELAQSMVTHEQSIKRMAEMEAAGIESGSLDDVIRQLVFPLPEPK